MNTVRIVLSLDSRIVAIDTTEVLAHEMQAAIGHCMRKAEPLTIVTKHKVSIVPYDVLSRAIIEVIEITPPAATPPPPQQPLTVRRDFDA